MREVKLTIKNYRCFDDNAPLIIDIGRNFTALIGPNNSGKSSLLKFFVEFRTLWNQFGHSLPNYLSEHNFDSNNLRINAVEDIEEVFSNTNQRPLSIDIQLKGLTKRTSGLSRIVRVTCSFYPQYPYRWDLRFFSDENNREITKKNNFGWREPFLSVSGPDGQTYDCGDFLDVMQSFNQALYIGPFRNAINEGAGNYYDLAIGSSFISMWNSWKAGGNKAQNNATEAVTADIRQIFEYQSLEINASQDQKTLRVNVNGKPYRLPELGAGLAQFIIVLGNAAIKKPPVILVDEPELNLHPSLQIDFLTSLSSYARDAIIYATHSIGLARSTADRIYSFQTIDGRSIVKPFEQTPNYTEFVGEMSFSAFKEMGCDQILLVEGVHDVKTVQQFLRMRKKDHRVVIIPLGGNQLARGGIEMELAELKRLSNNISALVDSERDSVQAEPKPERLAFTKVCERLGIPVCITARRAVENYFPDQAVKAALGDSYEALKPYESLSKSPNGWHKADNWRIARKMILKDIDQTDIGQFLEEICL